MATAKLFVIFTKDSESLGNDVYKRLLGNLLFISNLFMLATEIHNNMGDVETNNSINNCALNRVYL